MNNPYKKAQQQRSVPKAPKLNIATKPLPQEHSEAIPTKEPVRNFRLMTQVHDEYGWMLEDMRQQMRRAENRKVKLAEVLERAIQSLHETLK